MWRDHPFSQRNMTAEKNNGGGGGGVWTKLKIGGGLYKITALAPSANYVKRLKISHPPIIKLTPPPFLAFPPISSKNFPFLPLQPF